MSGLDPALLLFEESPDAQRIKEPFEESVRARIEQILCGLDPVDMRVINGRADDFPNATYVYITIDAAPGGSGRVGQADYDPCNLYANDVAVIWAGELLAATGPGWSRSAWVNILANVCAHEIGHTLGFGHPDTPDKPIGPPLADQAIMVSAHTIYALAEPMEFTLSQDTCPEANDAGGNGVSYTIVDTPVANNLARTARRRPADSTRRHVFDTLQSPDHVDPPE
jgi:hypothetical protein